MHDFWRRLGEFLAEEIVGSQDAMAAQAIQTMQFEMLLKMRQAHEFLKRGLVHPHGVHEAHVIFDQSQNLLAIAFRKSQALADRLHHLHPDLAWSSKRMRSGAMRKVGGLPTSCNSAPQAKVGARLRQILQQQQRMHEDVALGMKLRRLLHTLHVLDLWQHFVQQAGLIEQ